MNNDKTKSKYKALVHFPMQLIGLVMLSNTKHVLESPFAEFILSEVEGLRVTLSLRQSLIVGCRWIYEFRKRKIIKSYYFDWCHTYTENNSPKTKPRKTAARLNRRLPKM
jgi:hypothetical protein